MERPFFHYDNLSKGQVGGGAHSATHYHQLIGQSCSQSIPLHLHLYLHLCFHSNVKQSLPTNVKIYFFITFWLYVIFKLTL